MNPKNPQFRGKPWDHPNVKLAQEVHGVRFKHPKHVADYENAIQRKGWIDNDARLTCNACGQFKTDHKEGHAEQGMLDLDYGK
jgi:hypothetical protein